MKHIVTIVVVLFIVNAASGQITLDESTLDALLGKRLVDVSYDATDTTGTMALYMQAGENQTWNITSYGWVASDTFSIDFLANGAGTPGENDPDFAASNLVTVSSIDDTTIIANASYAHFDNTGLRNLGNVFVGYIDEDMVADTAKSLYTPAELDISFPFTFGTMVSDSVTHTQFVADTVQFQEVVAKDGEVDGWGTLITPDGSYDVLRYKYEERFYAFGFVFVDTTVEWWGPTGPIFQITSESSPFGPPVIYVSYSTQTVVDATAIDPGDFDVPATFALQQNYPNPFNPSTTIPFELQESAFVTLAIYDLLGRQVEVLVNSQLPVGSHEVSWSATNVPGGLYVARIEVDGQRQARTMTLLK